MPRPSDDERLAVLNSRMAKLQRQIRTIKSREKDQARRIDARRKIIAGALALEHLARNPGSEFGQTLFQLLHRYVRPEERVLFDFLPQRDADPPSASAAA
jgi:hypothetical protein